MSKFYLLLLFIILSNIVESKFLKFTKHQLRKKILKMRIRQKAKFYAKLHYKNQLKSRDEPDDIEPEQAADKRSDTFEEYEKADYMPSKFYRDVCCIAADGSPCKLECENDDCYRGKIQNVYMGFYGQVDGECPNFAHNWKCVKEVHGIIAENDKEKYKCEQAKECEIAVAGEDFDAVDWTTNIVNGLDAPKINHYPWMNGCALVTPKRLALIATCECSNPVYQEEHDVPEMPKAIESQ